MSESSGRASRPHWSLRLLRYLLVRLVVLAGIGAALWFARATIAEALIEALTGSDVYALRGLAFWPSLSVETVAWDTNPELPDAIPDGRIDGLELEYKRDWEAERPFPRLAADSVSLAWHLYGREAESGGFEFDPASLWNAYDSASRAWIPEAVAIASSAWAVYTPVAAADVVGLRMAADFEGTQHATVELQGEEATVRYTGTERARFDGAMAWTATLARESLSLYGSMRGEAMYAGLDVPETTVPIDTTLRASAASDAWSVELAHDGERRMAAAWNPSDGLWSLQANAVAVPAAMLAPALDLLDVDLRVGTLGIPRAALTGSLEEAGPDLSAAEVELHASDLALVMAGDTWAWDDVVATFSTGAGDTGAVGGTIILDTATALRIETPGSWAEGPWRVSVEDLGRDAAESWLPERYAAVLGALPGIERASIDAEIGLDDTAVAASVEASFGITEYGTVPASGSLSVEHAQVLLANAHVVLGDGRLSVRSSDGTTYEATAMAAPAALLGVVFGLQVPSDFAATRVDGTARISVSEAPTRVEPRLALSRMPEVWGTTAQLDGILEADVASADRWSGELAARLGEDLVASLAGAEVDTTALSLGGRLRGSSPIGGLPIPDESLAIGGEVSVAGQLLATTERIRMDAFEVRWDTPRIVGLDLPDAITAASEGALAFDVASGRVSVDAATIAMGTSVDGTVSGLAVLPEPGPAGGYSVRAESTSGTLSLHVLEHFGILEDALGEVRWSVDAMQFPFGDSGSWTLELDAETATFPLAYSILESVEGLATGGFEAAGPIGEGSLSLGALEAAGVRAEDSTARIRIDGGAVHIENLVLAVLGGSLDVDIAVQPFAAGVPVALDARAQRIDLAAFTEAFEPPNVSMTGSVGGTARIGVADSGLVGFDVELESDGEVSLNREAVEQILLSQEVGDVSGGRVLSRVVQRVIGDAPQRPFDRARLDLDLEAGRIVGVIELESENLNLSVDLRMDPQALLSAIQAQQRPGS